MAGKFAERTRVPVVQSKGDIETLVTKYGATGFMTGWLAGSALIAFEVKGRRVKFILPLPKEGSANYDQACRQRWRAMLLCIKSKLECVESGILTFEEEFMAHIVLPNGLTVGEATLPRLAEAMKDGKLPPLLPGT